MKKTKENLQATCTMPFELYKDLKSHKDINLLSIFDSNMYNHYKKSEDWQEAHELYRSASESKKDIEAEIKFNLLNNN